MRLNRRSPIKDAWLMREVLRTLNRLLQLTSLVMVLLTLGTGLVMSGAVSDCLLSVLAHVALPAIFFSLLLDTLLVHRGRY
ncbi:hypothetical protein PS918_03080 [Pseudomonas fluorescens]|uniref:Uncharacterized protein n=1 Tax=Pseudomonas fluorescens TaxID=294 RepID=A0A5E7STY0_PSEFL|nr:hypothetical protein PS918_03080 [Pseudomonas fluorescens]